MRGQVEVVVGSVEGGGCVEVASSARDVLVDRAARNKFGTLEHQMFEKMCEAGAVWAFVFASHLVEHVGGNDRSRVVLMEDDVHPIGEGVFGELDGLTDASNVSSLSQFFSLADFCRGRMGGTAKGHG